VCVSSPGPSVPLPRPADLLADRFPAPRSTGPVRRVAHPSLSDGWEPIPLPPKRTNGVRPRRIANAAVVAEVFRALNMTIGDP